MSKIEYSPIALEDLQSIRNNISLISGDSVAKKVLIKIISDIKRLEQFPLSGVDLGNIIDTPTKYRYIFSEKNYIFYHVEREKIRIVRVLNERQDFMQHLFGIGTETDE